MNAMIKKDEWDNDTVYLLRRMDSNIILQHGEDIGLIIRRIGTYLWKYFG